MKKVYIVVGSITNAMSGQRLLDSHRIYSTIRRNKDFSVSVGCGYSLEIKSSDIDKAELLLREKGIRIRGIV